MFGAFLMVTAAAAAAGVPKATPIDVYSWFSADDYPAEAQKQRIEGDVTFEVEVSVDGKPTACRIAKSSGSAILDKTTCDIVLARAKFKPAMRHGKAVPGRYSKKAVWRLEGTSFDVANGYSATIVDFSKDAEHPSCSVVSKTVAGPSCSQVLKEFGSLGSVANVSKLVLLVAIANRGEQTYQGDPGWGRRMSFVAYDLYAPKAGSKPGCAVVQREGTTVSMDPCAGYVDASTLSDEDKQRTKVVQFEQSVFGDIQRAPSQGKCKSGESTAEAHGCV
jgi:TonB family protein